MQRLFVEPSQILEESHRICVNGGDVIHIRNVLRMKVGEELWVSDGQLEYHCEIESLTGEEILLHILYAQQPDYELKSRIYLFQGLPRGDKMDWIIQKAVELGAWAVVPVEMKRSVVRLDGKKAEKKVQRWQQIARSAAEQSRRMRIPEILPVTDFSGALKVAQSLDVLLLPYELARGMEETREILKAISPGESVGIFIGPEGGFEETEVERAVAAGARTVTLGHRILRTETAGMTLLSVLMFHLEED
ncbi:MAG: 16S rRNA (uracil(1498)-N(3))-methyltransferase [Clostridiales bacterium]|nr:16S rRNA (uracil(1498)-N(3))-methyltransferase [Clostridiales bacterium]